LGRLAWPEETGPPQDAVGWFEDLEHVINQAVEYGLLRGPSPREAAQIPDYDPTVAQRVAARRAEREQELIHMLDEEPEYRNMLDDIVRARYLVWEVGDRLPELLWRGGMRVESFLYKGPTWISAFVNDIPDLAVRVVLTLQTDRNGSRAWSPNDIHDLDGLSAAVPYCDVVVTEKYGCEVMNRSGLADRYHTRVIRNLNELEPIVGGLSARAADDSPTPPA
jgi:hypothetical protein